MRRSAPAVGRDAPSVCVVINGSPSGLDRDDVAVARGRGAVPLRDHAPEDALAQRLDHFAAFDQRLHRHAGGGAAIVLDHDQILRDVDQAQMAMVQVAKDLAAKGEIMLAAAGSDDELIY